MNACRYINNTVQLYSYVVSSSGKKKNSDDSLEYEYVQEERSHGPIRRHRLDARWMKDREMRSHSRLSCLLNEPMNDLHTRVQHSTAVALQQQFFFIFVFLMPQLFCLGDAGCQ